MKRRAFVTGLGAVLAAPLAAEAQAAGKVPRIGLLDYAKFWDPLLDTLNELGYVEGRTIIFEYRSSEGRSERLPALALDLVNRGVDIIVTYGTLATQVAKRATATIPIVMVGVGEPVDTGLVASLARPGANITGSTILGPDLGAKRVEFLREAIPGISRIAFLWNPQNASNRVQFGHVQAGVRALGLTLLSVQASGPGEFDGAFAAMMKQRPDALMVTADPAQQRFVERIVRFAAAQRLPTMYQVKENVIDGGLISYGPSLPDLFGRSQVCRQDSERNQARQSSRRAAHEVRARHQPQDRQGARPHHPADAAVAGESGHRMKGRGSRQNVEGWARRKTTPAPPVPKPARPPRRPGPAKPAPPKPR